MGDGESIELVEQCGRILEIFRSSDVKYSAEHGYLSPVSILYRI